MAISQPLIDSSARLDFQAPQWRARVRAVRQGAVFLSGVAGCLAGAVLLFGWILDIDVMRRLIPGQAGMAISTAVGLLGCALCILLQPAAAQSGRFALRRFVVVLLLLVAVGDLVVLAVLPGRGLDHLLFGFTDARAQIYMSPATAVCLALAAVCLLIPPRRGSPFAADAFNLLSATGMAFATFALTAYVFDSQALREVFVFAAMSPQTAFGFLLIFLALAMSRPTVGWMRLITGPGPGSAMLRRTLPFVGLGPFVLCGVTLLVVDAGLFSPNFRLSLLAIFSAGGLVALAFWSALRENADWRQLAVANSRLQRALAERDVLLKEVYHRVKNNLQFVDAMLAIESASGRIGDEGERLAQIRNRVHALSLVHQQLIAAQDLATLDLRDFLRQLCGNLAHGGGFDARGIRVETAVVAVNIDLDRAVPIGLIVTELLSNAAKHAFPDGRRGTIKVHGMLDGGWLRLVVADDGVGRGESTEGKEGKAGDLILRSLVHQLCAEMSVGTGAGYSVELAVPLS